MMKRIIATGVMTLTFVAPFAVSALTLSELQAQLVVLQDTIRALAASSTVSSAPLPQTSRICRALPNRSLGLGARGNDVVLLQEFLRDEGMFAAEATGYFGSITAQALARWQASQGVDAAAVAGPLTRQRIRAHCDGANRCASVPVPHCDGATPQARRDTNGCVVGYECPVYNFTPPSACKAWNDGCNECSRQTPGGPAACTKRACFAAGKGYCSSYFDTAPANRPPVISGFSGPTTLSLGEIGTWTLRAYDPEDGSLTYAIAWGDERTLLNVAMQTYADSSAVQDTSFTHSYLTAGTYTVAITVTDDAGNQARATASTLVGGGATACTMEYAPVCAQPAEPACRRSIPACMIATPGPQTYGNRCVMQAAGATFIHDGECAAL